MLFRIVMLRTTKTIANKEKSLKVLLKRYLLGSGSRHMVQTFKIKFHNGKRDQNKLPENYYSRIHNFSLHIFEKNAVYTRVRFSDSSTYRE